MGLINTRITRIRKLSYCEGCHTSFTKGSFLKKFFEKDFLGINYYFLCKTCEEVTFHLEDDEWFNGDLKEG